MLVSAKAIPTCLHFVLELASAAELATLMAMTIGAESKSELTKRSSTACRFPGEAYRLMSKVFVSTIA
jgi:hypothetical protein